MEPMNATARVTADGCEIWAPTPQWAQKVVAKILSLEPERVKINTTYLGGGLVANSRSASSGARKGGRDGQLNQPPPAGHFRGIAMHQAFGSIVAEVAEISIENDGLRVHRVDCTVDCGLAINPDTIAAQMESGIVYGLTAALCGEITTQAEAGGAGQFRYVSDAAFSTDAQDLGVDH
jgi:CO/xanthine dehydrogenase Mo-binding subunit